MQFLIFTLYAPLSSWGDTTVGEVRSSWDRPGRSAILGLLAAAHGIERTDETVHTELDAALRIGVRTAASGREVFDYHTAQDPTGVAVRRFRPSTRKEALECAEPDTTLSRRTLFEDGLFVVALWSVAKSRWTLDDHARALAAPCFPLYAGRKANVLALPLAARVIAAATLAGALHAMPSFPPELNVIRPREGWGRTLAYDECTDDESGVSAPASVVRRDASPSRMRWQFADRRVLLASLPLDNSS